MAVNPARAGMIRYGRDELGTDRGKPRASGDDPRLESLTVRAAE